jgi:hypothetical protein
MAFFRENHKIWVIYRKIQLIDRLSAPSHT